MVSPLLAPAAALTFLFGWNNSAFLIGNIRGSGTLTFRGALLTTVVGLVAGVFFEGPKMLRSLDGFLSPVASFTTLAITLVASILVTLGFTSFNLPVSFTAAMVGAFLGATYPSGLPINLGQAELVISFWFVAPLLTGILTFLLYNGVARLVSNFGILTVDSINRVGVVVSSLAVSYSLGANNIGLIYGTATGTFVGLDDILALVGLALLAVLGTALFGRGGVTGTVGDKMLALSPQGVLTVFVSSALVIWIGTQLAVPVSIGQCVLGGMFGAAYAKSVTVVNKKLAAETISGWVVVPLASFVIAYFASAV